MIDRLTLPQHPELLEKVAVWLSGLAGQPNSVILDLALYERKLGAWAMERRPITHSIKLSFLPFVQRAVLEAFIGVAPAGKDTKRSALERPIIWQGRGWRTSPAHA